MTTHENGSPETPDWTPEPRTAFEHIMTRLMRPLPEATWKNPGDLSRISVEAMARKAALDIPPTIVLGEN